MVSDELNYDSPGSQFLKPCWRPFLENTLPLHSGVTSHTGVGAGGHGDAQETQEPCHHGAHRCGDHVQAREKGINKKRGSYHGGN